MIYFVVVGTRKLKHDKYFHIKMNVCLVILCTAKIVLFPLKFSIEVCISGSFCCLNILRL